MDHASEYSHKLVSAEEEAAVRGAVRRHASFPPYLDEFPAKRKDDEMYLMDFPGLVPAATCGLNREHFSTTTASATARRTTQELLQVQTRPAGALAGALPCWRLSWPT
jgi:hypothetical protein